MGKIEELAAVYQRHVSAPWQRTLAGAQRVMLVVYEKESERILRARLAEFEQATRRSGHSWKLVDCTRWFAEWMAADEYRDAYFEDPSLLGQLLDAPELCAEVGELRAVVILFDRAPGERVGDPLDRDPQPRGLAGVGARGASARARASRSARGPGRAASSP